MVILSLALKLEAFLFSPVPSSATRSVVTLPVLSISKAPMVRVLGASSFAVRLATRYLLAILAVLPGFVTVTSEGWSVTVPV